MKECKHQFIPLGEKTKPMGQITNRYLLGVRVGCVLCSEIREIYEDGELIIFCEHDKKR